MLLEVLHIHFGEVHTELSGEVMHNYNLLLKNACATYVLLGEEMLLSGMRSVLHMVANQFKHVMFRKATQITQPATTPNEKRTTEWLGWEETPADHLVQPPCSSRVP